MKKELGIYIHIPFCASKCAYCDFYSRPGMEKLMPEYHNALLHHIRESAGQLQSYAIDSIYFGGGTPSYFGAARLIQIFDTLKDYGNVALDAEVTLEANPDSITLIDLVRLKKAGFNRISIGAQCADDSILKAIGRRHNFQQVKDAVSNARKAGFDNVSIDLIYGLPSQTKEGWADTIFKAVNLNVDHISGYGLKIEKGTELYPYRNSPFIPDDDAQADMYLYMTDTLATYGFRQYEISNFAKPGKESRHNMKYWTGGEYMSFGAAAHSYVGGQRYSYIADAKGYCDAIFSGDTIVDQSEYISDFERAGEYLMLGLRTSHGISEDEYVVISSGRFDKIKERLELLIKHGFVEHNGERYSLTSRGFLVSNVIIGQVLDIHTEERSKIISPMYSVGEERLTMFERDRVDTPLFNGISQ